MAKERSLMATIVLGVGALAVVSLFSLGVVRLAAEENLGQLAGKQRRVLGAVEARSRAALASIQRSNA